MMRSDLPSLALADLPGGPETVVLAATARLAGDLRRAHGELQAAAGAQSWRALQSATAAQWLDHLCSSALLRGEIPADSVPGTFLSWPQERAVWEQAIAHDTHEKGLATELFDRDGLAHAAMEAASLCMRWRVEIPEAMHSEETMAFARWQARVSAISASGNWHGADAALNWRIGCIARGIGGLPQRLGIAGFVASDPLLSRLLVALEARGVELFRLDYGRAAGAQVVTVKLADAEAECHAAAAWARDLLQRAPSVAMPAMRRIRIAVADLPARRRLLESALDAALRPQQLGAGWAAQESAHVFVAGTPLTDEALVDVALRLLQLYVHPRRVTQIEFGALLCTPGWSADVSEADARARVEASLRELLPPAATLERFQRAMARLAGSLAAARLAGHIAALVELMRQAPRRQLPGMWGGHFIAALDALAWPGERPLQAKEQAACQQLREMLQGLAALDSMLGKVDAAEALRQLQRQCRDKAFHAPRRIPVQVEICSLDDAIAAPVDALWIMGMNEAHWPVAPRPNPLLPADLQRRAGIVAARADSLVEQARAMQALWLKSATELVFSWAGRDGERDLRPSPMLADYAAQLATAAVPVLMAEGMPAARAKLDAVIDALAPPVAADERIRGGTALLQAQAICPAWGFYAYRLGAAVLPAPTFGLDAMARGSLLHSALEAFWFERNLDYLKQMDESACARAVGKAVDFALVEYDRHALDPLPPRLRALEGERLSILLTVWLRIEAQRPDFRVRACEQRHDLDIEGLPVRVVIDRIDELADGRLAIIDYKSGRRVSAEHWAETRISEPQLPIYAALAFPDDAVAAVALARVTLDNPAFLGVAESAGLLPEVKSLDDQRRRYEEAEFPDWDAVRQRWAERIREIAGEVRDGCAAVVFADEKDIEYCDVRPLLRVAERRRQFEESE